MKAKVKTRIFGFVSDETNGVFEGVAITEHGKILFTTTVEKLSMLPYELGMIPGYSIQSKLYNHHCKDGFVLEYVPKKDVDNHVGLQNALKKLAQREDIEDEK